MCKLVSFMRNILLYLQGKVKYKAKPIVKEYLKKQEDIFLLNYKIN